MVFAGCSARGAAGPWALRPLPAFPRLSWRARSRGRRSLANATSFQENMVFAGYMAHELRPARGQFGPRRRFPGERRTRPAHPWRTAHPSGASMANGSPCTAHPRRTVRPPRRIRGERCALRGASVANRAPSAANGAPSAAHPWRTVHPPRRIRGELRTPRRTLRIRGELRTVRGKRCALRGASVANGAPSAAHPWRTAHPPRRTAHPPRRTAHPLRCICGPCALGMLVFWSGVNWPEFFFVYPQRHFGLHWCFLNNPCAPIVGMDGCSRAMVLWQHGVVGLA